MALADYMHSFLGDLATDLDWSVAGGSYTFATDDAIESYGETSEANCTDLVKAHAIAKVKVLEAVVRATAGAVDFSADNASYKMSQINAQAKKLLDDVYNEALPYLPVPDLNVDGVDFGYDVYLRSE